LPIVFWVGEGRKVPVIIKRYPDHEIRICAGFGAISSESGL
jgi:hypothetical protein